MTDVDPRDLPRVVLARDTPPRQLRAAQQAGTVSRLRPGAYLPAVAEEVEWQRRERSALAQMVAVDRQLPGRPVFCHASAALLHGLWLGSPDGQAHIVQRQNAAGRRSPGITRHHDTLREEDITLVRGLRVTTIERTIADCARSLSPRDGLAVADSGMRALLRPDRRAPIEARIQQLRGDLRQRVAGGPPRWRRRALAVVRHADPRAESAPESALRWIAVALGLPAPVLQRKIVTRLGVFYADLAWEVEVREPDGTVETWLAILEYDGAIKYLPPDAISDQHQGARNASAAVVAEKRREDAIRELPRTRIRRFQWADLADARRAFARICEAFPPGGLPELHPVPELLDVLT